MSDSRFLRGAILQALYAAHPLQVPDNVLIRTCGEQGFPMTAERLASELVYLRDWPEIGDGYVSLRLASVPGSNETIGWSRITPRGINLMEKMSPPDPMIAL